MKYLEIINKIRELTLLDGKSLTQRALKLSEETGEVAAAVLSAENAPGCEYKTMTTEDVIEECIDVLIVDFSMLAQLDVSDEEIIRVFNKKLNKWKKVCS